MHVTIETENELTPFTDSSDLLDDVAALRERLAEDGYLFVRDLAPKAALADLSDAFIAAVDDAGWLAEGSASRDAIAEPTASCADPDPRYEPVRLHLFRLEGVHRLLHHPRFIALFRALFDEAVLPHPKPNVRAYFPGRSTWAHHDYFEQQGSRREYTLWLPTSACPRRMGALQIARGSHHLDLPGGVLDAAGNAAVASRWCAGDFELGDAVIFNAKTVHRAPPNDTDRLRFSIDMRYQPRSEPISAAALLEDWPAVYAGWSSSACKYYWKRWQVREIPVDTSGVTADELREFEALPPEKRRAHIYERWQRGFAGAPK
jgi:ectoine hydroxylase-related dioxygenase (phytanoyl-CoA dioxygenase family)